MKLGLIARADNSGLGMQTWEFYKHMHPFKTMVVDISKYNGNRQYPERYGDDATFIKGFPTDPQVVSFLQDLDVVFIAEAAYNPHLYDLAREMGVKTAVQYNYEFMDWLINPSYPKPDMLIAPSRWHYEDVQRWCDHTGVQHVYLHCPVNRQLLPPRSIEGFKTFLHVAGKAAAHDRNGTMTVIEASRYLKTDAKIKVHFQGDQGLAHQVTSTFADYIQLGHDAGNPDKLSIYKTEYEDYADVYQEGDVMLLPRRYGGNCLPLNEALSVGMPVIMPDISPNNYFLPPNWLLPASIVGDFSPRTTVDIYNVAPEVLAAKIDEMFNMSRAEAMHQSLYASMLANSISWDKLKLEYEEVLRRLCTLS